MHIGFKLPNRVNIHFSVDIFSYSSPSGIMCSDGKQNTASGHENCCTFQ